jgi:hypothetical protein
MRHEEVYLAFGVLTIHSLYIDMPIYQYLNFQEISKLHLYAGVVTH